MVLKTMTATPDNYHGLEVPESSNSDGAALHEAIRTLTAQLSLETVLQQFRTVTGREPDGVGTVLPGSYSGDDTCHLWNAGIPCLLYGPGGGSESETIPDEYTRISDMEQVAKVLALTALDVCNLLK